MKERKVLRSFVMISQLGISMMVPIFLCGVKMNFQQMF